MGCEEEEDELKESSLLEEEEELEEEKEEEEEEEAEEEEAGLWEESEGKKRLNREQFWIIDPSEETSHTQNKCWLDVSSLLRVPSHLDGSEKRVERDVQSIHTFPPEFSSPLDIILTFDSEYREEHSEKEQSCTVRVESLFALI